MLPGQLPDEPGSFAPVHPRDLAQSRGDRSARVKGHLVAPVARVRGGIRPVPGHFGVRPETAIEARPPRRGPRWGRRRISPAGTTLRHQDKSITTERCEQGVIRGRPNRGPDTSA
ncbi:hypothetical protein GCM10020366_16540 [Saccharopolyspora gregorii]|uniref:Uncharacterized protein n=1 Tax=Saccharopolyspora gregorii TaxID=33914 RepID=A0ABP6RMB4_9PSEU